MKKVVYIMLATVLSCGLLGWTGGEAKGQNQTTVPLVVYDVPGQ